MSAAAAAAADMAAKLADDNTLVSVLDSHQRRIKGQSKGSKLS